MKFGIMKISSQGLGGNFAKFCSIESFPLYSIILCVYYNTLWDQPSQLLDSQFGLIYLEHNC